jgi:RHH-type rel operon transcriptional repressor/antitoxin RelB
MQKQTNSMKTVSFRLDAGKVAELDELGKAQARDRTFVLNEAVDAYLEVQRWQLAHIEEGIRQADSGMGKPHEEVVAKWRRRLR